jgi:hypothetical protein
MRKKHQPKRIASVTLSVIAFCLAAAHETDRLQKFMDHIPPEYAKHLPLVYIALGVFAFLLLKSAHEDDLKNANTSRPRITLEWLNDSAPPSPYAPVRVRNYGDSEAFDVEAVVRIGDFHSIRIDLSSPVAPHSEMLVSPSIDNGHRVTLANRDHAQIFFRLALKWESAAMEEFRKQHARIVSVTRSTTPTPLPDVSVSFNVTYLDFDRRRYAIPHTLTYFDATNEIQIRLATSEDA